MSVSRLHEDTTHLNVKIYDAGSVKIDPDPTIKLYWLDINSATVKCAILQQNYI